MSPTHNSMAPSFWATQQAAPIIGQPAQQDISVDVAIIGGGFTGLSAAREILRQDPSMRVVVCEAKYIGYGASGRNGGFNMTLFGLEPQITLMRWGRQKTIEAQAYTNRAVTYVRDLISEYDLQSDYQHSGMVRVAYSAPQYKRLQHNMKLFEQLGIGDQYQWMDKQEIQSSIHSTRFQAGLYEQNSGILNPYKHVRELKRIAENAGAMIYENTPVHHISRIGGAIKLTTPKASIRCEKLVIAVNAWSGQIHGLPRIRTRQTPVWTAQVVTEPLSAQQWQDIGWDQRQSIEDNRQLLHYFRRTICGRATMGGGGVAFPAKNSIGTMDTKAIWEGLKAHVRWLFPQLKNISFEYQWGGPVSVNLDLTPDIGFIGDERIIFANGCIGHGVALTQLNGKTIAELILQKQSELTDFWMVNRKAIAWPPGLLGSATIRMIAGGLKLWDRLEERKLEK